MKFEIYIKMFDQMGKFHPNQPTDDYRSKNSLTLFYVLQLRILRHSQEYGNFFFII